MSIRPRHPAIPMEAPTLTEIQVRPTFTGDPPDVADLVYRVQRRGIRCVDACPYEGVCLEGQCIIAEN